jgi:hypothetical protein
MTEAVARLAGVFAVNASDLITYTQGQTTISDLKATIGRTPFEVMDGEVMIAYESRDYIVSAADMVDGNGDPVIPASGDTITDADGTVREVSVPKPLNVYESIGPTGAVLKIHTKGPY